MAIGNVVQRGRNVVVYDENGNEIWSKGIGEGKDDGLKGYTSSTVNIRIGSNIFTYDERGNEKHNVSA